MSKNILLVCSSKELRKELSKILARDTKMLHIDADELLDFEILNRQEISIKEAGEVLKHLEQDYINRVVNFKNCVITMSDQLFLSNDNFNLLKNIKKVYIQTYPQQEKKHSNKYKFEQDLLMYDDINNLLISLCDITIKAENNLSKLSQEIIYKLGLQ